MEQDKMIIKLANSLTSERIGMSANTDNKNFQFIDRFAPNGTFFKIATLNQNKDGITFRLKCPKKKINDGIKKNTVVIKPNDSYGDVKKKIDDIMKEYIKLANSVFTIKESKYKSFRDYILEEVKDEEIGSDSDVKTKLETYKFDIISGCLKELGDDYKDEIVSLVNDILQIFIKDEYLKETDINEVIAEICQMIEAGELVDFIKYESVSISKKKLLEASNRLRDYIDDIIEYGIEMYSDSVLIDEIDVKNAISNSDEYVEELFNNSVNPKSAARIILRKVF